MLKEVHLFFPALKDIVCGYRYAVYRELDLKLTYETLLVRVPNMKKWKAALKPDQKLFGFDCLPVKQIILLFKATMSYIRRMDIFLEEIEPYLYPLPLPLDWRPERTKTLRLGKKT